MDVGKSFSFIFEDPEWLTKILVGSIIFLISLILSPLLIGLLGFAIITGYALEMLKNVRQGSALPLPAWRDRWGEWLVLGLKLWLALLIWSLPGILLSVPGGIGSALVDQGGDLATLGSLMGFCFGCLAFLWTLVLLLVSPAIYIRLAETEKVSSGLQFADILAFTRDHIGNVIIAVIVYLIASLILTLIGGLVGTILCVVGLLITLPAAWLISTLIEAHLYAQIGLGEKAIPAS